MTPATLDATRSWSSNISSNEPSKRSAHRVRRATRVDQLRGDAHPISGFAHRAFEHVAHPELAADLLHIDSWPLYVKLELRAMTNSHRMRDSAVMISSTMPSTKYSCSGSPLIF